MQLIVSPTSPYVRKARVLLRETGLLESVKEVDVNTNPMESAAEVIAANPLGKIPALIRNDGPAIYDSRVICRFLNEVADANLYPETGLWELLTLEATAEGILDVAVGMAYEVKFREENAWEEWLDKHWEKIDRALTAIESMWMGHLAGPLNIGQIATGCALGYLDLRHDARAWRSGRPALTEWYEGFSQRPSMRDTVPA